MQKQPRSPVFSNDLTADKTVLILQYWARTNQWSETRHEIIDRLKDGLASKGIALKKAPAALSRKLRPACQQRTRVESPLAEADRNDRQTRSGLSTEAELIDVLAAEDLPCIMPPDWLVVTMQMDIKGSGIAIHESTLDASNMWKLELRVVA